MQYRKRKTFWAFTLLWILDAIFTTMLVIQYGPDMELNPFLRWSIVNFGLWTLWAYKALSWTGWWYVNAAYEKEKGKPVTWLLDGALVAIMIPVCYAGFKVAFGL